MSLIKDLDTLVVINPKCSHTVLARYAKHKFWLIRALVALHRRTKQRTLRSMLLCESSDIVIGAIASRLPVNSTNQLNLHLLIQHPEEVVRAGTASNRGLYRRDLRILLRDPSQLVRDAAGRNQRNRNQS